MSGYIVRSVSVSIEDPDTRFHGPYADMAAAEAAADERQTEDRDAYVEDLEDA